MASLDMSTLAGQLYEAAPTAARIRLLESLLRRMSVYALIGIANGLFAQIKSASAEWQGFRLRAEDIKRVGANDVAALVDAMQRSGIDVGGSLRNMVASSPGLAQSGPAVALQPLQQPGAKPAAAAIYA